ncbi:MAG: prepilin-type N-terminal cleavage/methylation domain-containing protein [Victivallaceae bacterium]|nr:prepilin-type N-terminal cleavage/methylation domain-containing protein [Victivallaceae bacterium]
MVTLRVAFPQNRKFIPFPIHPESIDGTFGSAVYLETALPKVAPIKNQIPFKTGEEEIVGRKKRYFTLIELMVVIAILAVLAGLILGASRRASAMARRSACIGNLSQIALALELYAQNNRYRLPECRGSLDEHAGPSIRETLSAQLGGAKSKVFECPADPERQTRDGGSYDWNTRANGRKLDERALLVMDFEMPVMADYDNFHDDKALPTGKNWLYLPRSVQKELKH